MFLPLFTPIIVNKKNCPRVPGWHPADSCAGHVRAPKSTKKLLFMIMQGSAAIPLDYIGHMYKTQCTQLARVIRGDIRRYERYHNSLIALVIFFSTLHSLSIYLHPRCFI